MKRILTIQDISCVGKCSLTVALPVISALGIETCILPTALLSTHTGFKNFSFLNLSGEFDNIADKWQREGIGFDGIYTGFLGSIDQIELIESLFSRFKSDSTLLLIDPCMGDNGRLYHGFDEKFAQKMAEFCRYADTITPNITEASYLTQMPYFQDGYDKSYIDELLVRLTSLGAKRVVLKGINYGDDKCGVIALDTQSGQRSEYFHELLPLHASGTGDIFASVLFGSLVLGASNAAAIKRAADFVLSSIRHTLADAERTWYGVQFEKTLHTLNHPF